MIGLVQVAVVLAMADVPRVLSDGLASQWDVALSNTSAHVRSAYLEDAELGCISHIQDTSDDVIVSMVAHSFRHGDDIVGDEYTKHLEKLRQEAEEAERKAREEAEKRRQEEEAARIAEEQARGGGQTQQESSSAVGADVAWLAAHVATGCYDIDGLLSTTGDRIDDARCDALYAVLDASLGANGVVFSDTSDVNVVSAILSCVCDGTIITSGDASGGIAELLSHLEESSAFEEVTGVLQPGDVCFTSSGVEIYVGRDAATAAHPGTTSTVFVIEPSDGETSYYPWLGAGHGAYTHIFRPKASNGIGVNWRALAS